MTSWPNGSKQHLRPWLNMYALLLGVVLGAPWVFGFAPWSLWWLPFLQLVVLGVLVQSASSLRAACALGFGFGWSAFAVGVSWLYISLNTYGGLPALLAALAVLAFTAYLGLYAAAACAVFYGCVKRLVLVKPKVLGLGANASACGLVFAAFWTFFEWLRGSLFTGFAWLNLGDVLVDSPFAAMLPWLGNHGAAAVVLAFAIVLFGLVGLARRCVLWQPTWHGRSALYLPLVLHGCWMVVLGSALAWMLQAPLHTQPQPVLQVAGVQTNLDQNLKFDQEKIVGNVQAALQLGHTAKALLVDGGLLLFPETVNPVLWDQSPAAWRLAFAGLAGNGHAVALGAALQEQGHFYNSYMLLRGNETQTQLITPKERHDKRHLVPFGEFIPPGFAWFVAMLNIPLGSFSAGQGPLQPWVWGGAQLAVTICYEDIFADELAALLAGASTEPTVLVNASNLAWFGQTRALDQHAQIGRTRSAEHRKPGLRITNTGLSGVIGVDGQWQQRVAPGQAKVWLGQVQGHLGKTPFARWGVWAWVAVWLSLCLPVLVLQAGLCLRRLLPTNPA